jgi:hypothetical protein
MGIDARMFIASVAVSGVLGGEVDVLAISQWAIQDSNLGPLPYQRSALTN